MFRPTDLLATPVAPTAVLPSTGAHYCEFHAAGGRASTGQPWLFHLSNVQFVASLYVRYASRPNRAIDDRGLAPHKIHSLVGCSPNSEPKTPSHHTMAMGLEMFTKYPTNSGFRVAGTIALSKSTLCAASRRLCAPR